MAYTNTTTPLLLLFKIIMFMLFLGWMITLTEATIFELDQEAVFKQFALDEKTNAMIFFYNAQDKEFCDRAFEIYQR